MHAAPAPDDSPRVPLYQLSEIRDITEPHQKSVAGILRELSGAAAAMQSYHDIEEIYQQIFGKKALKIICRAASDLAQ